MAARLGSELGSFESAVTDENEGAGWSSETFLFRPFLLGGETGASSVDSNGFPSSRT